jgi:hypothetical protein
MRYRIGLFGQRVAGRSSKNPHKPVIRLQCLNDRYGSEADSLLPAKSGHKEGKDQKRTLEVEDIARI